MTQHEQDFLIKHGKVGIGRLEGGGANPGDGLVWDGDEWVPMPPESETLAGGPVRGVDLPLNFQIGPEDNFATVEHFLGSPSIALTLLTTAYEGVWALFSAPWRVLDNNRIEVRVKHGFTGPARAVIQAVIPA